MLVSQNLSQTIVPLSRDLSHHASERRSKPSQAIEPQSDDPRQAIEPLREDPSQPIEPRSRDPSFLVFVAFFLSSLSNSSFHQATS